MVHAFNPKSREAETGRCLHSKFQDSPGYTEKNLSQQKTKTKLTTTISKNTKQKDHRQNKDRKVNLRSDEEKLSNLKN